MAELQPLEGRGFEVRRDQPLIGIPTLKGNEEVIQYFTDEEGAEASTTPASVQRALSLLGAWKDIDSEDALEELDRIRHEIKPTPPIDDL